MRWPRQSAAAGADEIRPGPAAVAASPSRAEGIAARPARPVAPRGGGHAGLALGLDLEEADPRELDCLANKAMVDPDPKQFRLACVAKIKGPVKLTNPS